MAYERALYFDTTHKSMTCNYNSQIKSRNPAITEGQGHLEMPQGTFFKPKFFDFVKEEYQACIEGVGIIDMSSFSKIEIKVDLFVNDFFYNVVHAALLLFFCCFNI